MSIRSEASNWVSKNYEDSKGKLYTSKYYLPEESWSKQEVWWFEIPLKVIQAKDVHFVDLICQAAPGKNSFHYLKVPLKFFRDRLENFHTNSKRISIYLSAQPKKLFVEERGNSNFNFINFLVSDSY
jgi:hypothetical protein